MCINLLGGLSAPKPAWTACPFGARGVTRKHSAGTHHQELTAHALLCRQWWRVEKDCLSSAVGLGTYSGG